jgi:hypothetical protein
LKPGGLLDSHRQKRATKCLSGSSHHVVPGTRPPASDDSARHLDVAPERTNLQQSNFASATPGPAQEPAPSFPPVLRSHASAWRNPPAWWTDTGSCSLSVCRPNGRRLLLRCMFCMIWSLPAHRPRAVHRKNPATASEPMKPIRGAGHWPSIDQPRPENVPGPRVCAGVARVQHCSSRDGSKERDSRLGLDSQPASNALHRDTVEWSPLPHHSRPRWRASNVGRGPA